MQFLAFDALQRARRVRLVIFDVDGVLTDGKLWYGPGGEELKAFHAFDGHGVKLLLMAGLKTALISGRDSPAVAERARELGIQHVLQGVDESARRSRGWCAA
jgi:3-deoxy-D-manno-octulosonate 8-phosphate phosphatase (KDO 8-P phosphatase)